MRNSSFLIYLYAVGHPSSKEVEMCFASGIEMMNNDAVAKALCDCEKLDLGTYQHLSKMYTTYELSLLFVNMILIMDKGGFEQLCGCIKDNVQVQQLKEIYSGIFDYLFVSTGQIALADLTHGY